MQFPLKLGRDIDRGMDATWDWESDQHQWNPTCPSEGLICRKVLGIEDRGDRITQGNTEDISGFRFSPSPPPILNLSCFGAYWGDIGVGSMNLWKMTTLSAWWDGEGGNQTKWTARFLIKFLCYCAAEDLAGTCWLVVPAEKRLSTPTLLACQH